MVDVASKYGPYEAGAYFDPYTPKASAYAKAWTWKASAKAGRSGHYPPGRWSRFKDWLRVQTLPDAPGPVKRHHMGKAWYRSLAKMHGPFRVGNKRYGVKSRTYKKRTYGKFKRRSYVKKRRGTTSRVQRMPKQPEAARTTIELLTQDTIDSYANDVVAFALATVGTRVDGSDIGIYDSNAAAGTIRNRTSAVPRNWARFNRDYDKFRVLKVTHEVDFTPINTSSEYDLKIMHWKNSTGHRDVPVSVTPIISIGNSEPYNGEAAAIRVENYRYTKRKDFVQHGQGKAARVKFTVRPYIYKDGAGQKTMGGKYNTDSSGAGQLVSHNITSLGVASGLAGQDCFMIQQRNHARVTWVQVNMTIKSKYTLEFFDRKNEIAPQTPVGTLF